jgi:alpha-L-fucosidase
LQPNIITNDRLKRPDYPGDFKTPEQRIPNLAEFAGTDWEACMTMNETWGYKSYAHDWKSTQMLIRNLIDIASKGGNYLLNIGPKADGTIPDESIERLSEIGKWMAQNGEAIYGTKGNPLNTLLWGRCTYKESNDKTILYVSVFDWPTAKNLTIPGITNKVENVSLLASGKKLKTNVKGNDLNIIVPEKTPDPNATVIKIVLKGSLPEKK